MKICITLLAVLCMSLAERVASQNQIIELSEKKTGQETLTNNCCYLSSTNLQSPLKEYKANQLFPLADSGAYLVKVTSSKY